MTPINKIISNLSTSQNSDGVKLVNQQRSIVYFWNAFQEHFLVIIVEFFRNRDSGVLQHLRKY